MKFDDQILLADGWRFSKGDWPDAVQMDFDDSGFTPVIVPHD